MFGCHYIIKPHKILALIILAVISFALPNSSKACSFNETCDVSNECNLGSLPISFDSSVMSVNCRKTISAVAQSNFANPLIRISERVSVDFGSIPYPSCDTDCSGDWDPTTWSCTTDCEIKYYTPPSITFNDSAVLNSWGQCVMLNGVSRYCARTVASGQHGAAAVTPPLPRMCVYQDPLDTMDAGAWMPFYQNQPYTTDLDGALQDMNLTGIAQPTGSAAAAFTNAITSLLGSVGVPFNYDVAGIVGSTCLPFPMAPSPPPFCPTLGSGPPALTAYRVCKAGETSLPQDPCVQGAVPSSFQRPLIRVAYDILVPFCTSSSQFSMGKCADIINKDLLNSEYVNVCPADTTSYSGVCVKVPSTAPVKSRYFVAYNLYKVGSLSQISSNQGVPWVQLNDPSYKLVGSGIQIGESVDLGLYYNKNTPVTEQQNLVQVYNNQSYTKQIKTSGDTTSPYVICALDGTAGDAEIGCVNRPSMTDLIIEACPACNTSTTDPATCLSQRTPIFGQSCVSIHQIPKIVAGFRPYTSGNITVPQQVAIFSTNNNDSQYLSSGSIANPSNYLEGVNLGSIVLDANRDKAAPKTWCSTAPAVSGEFINCNPTTTCDPLTKCKYKSGLVYSANQYIRGGSLMCIQGGNDADLLLVKKKSNGGASNLASDVLVPLATDTVNRLPYTTNGVKNYQNEYPSASDNYGRNVDTNTESTRKYNYAELGLCVAVPPPICSRQTVTDVSLNGSYSLKLSQVGNLTCNSAYANSTCSKQETSTYYDSAQDKTYDYTYDYKWSCDANGEWQPMTGTGSVTFKCNNTCP